MTTVLNELLSDSYCQRPNYWHEGIVLLDSNLTFENVGRVLGLRVSFEDGKIAIVDSQSACSRLRQSQLERAGLARLTRFNSGELVWLADIDRIKNWYSKVNIEVSFDVTDSPHYFNGVVLLRGLDLSKEFIDKILGVRVHLKEDCLKPLSNQDDNYIFSVLGFDCLELEGNLWRADQQKLECWYQYKRTSYLTVPVRAENDDWSVSIGRLIGYGVRVVDSQARSVATTPIPATKFLDDHLVDVDEDNYVWPAGAEQFFKVDPKELRQYHQEEFERSNNPGLVSFVQGSN